MGRHSRKGRGDKSRGNRESGKGGGSANGDAGANSGPDGGNQVRGVDPGTGDTGSLPVVPRLPDGTPAAGTPVVPVSGGTAAQGAPRLPDGSPARGVPHVRGGHPEQREPGGGWGEFGSDTASAWTPPGPRVPHQRQRPGPRQDYLDAFDSDAETDVFAPRGFRAAATQQRQVDPAYPHARVEEVRGGARGASAGGGGGRGGAGEGLAAGGDEGGRGGRGGHGGSEDRRDGRDGSAGAGEADGSRTGVRRGTKARTFTGLVAAALTAVLTVLVAGQVADSGDGTVLGVQSATGRAGELRASASPSASPSPSPSVTPLTYEQKMDKKYALSASLKGSGKFDAVPGVDKAPGKGRKYTYRVDVEKGLGLDAELFAAAVQKTLNDERSWAHAGARTFERIYSGQPDFVITLASPGTTAVWCAKSGLDTTVDNVSCDSASTERVMINAYRWAQGSKTYGDEIHAYRQMLINHEVGHRLGYHHVTCEKDGELAPVMQQQTKFLDHDGIHCLPNPWPYPGS